MTDLATPTDPAAATATATLPAVHVGLITWGPEHSDFDEFLIVSTNVATVNKALVAELIKMHAAAPTVFEDDSPSFLNGIQTSGGVLLEPAQKNIDIEAASADDLEQWLIGFREATTAPWWTVTEAEIV